MDLKMPLSTRPRFGTYRGWMDGGGDGCGGGNSEPGFLGCGLTIVCSAPAIQAGGEYLGPGNAMEFYRKTKSSTRFPLNAVPVYPALAVGRHLPGKFCPRLHGTIDEVCMIMIRSCVHTLSTRGQGIGGPHKPRIF